MHNELYTDEYWMNIALLEAEKASSLGEVPVGAVIVMENNIIAKSHNQSITSCNPVAHAEILALQQAAQVINNYRLIDCELYCTIEPCLMCAGAIIHSRIKRLVFGAYEPKAGTIISNFNLFQQPQINHSPLVTHGVLEKKCVKIMTDFFIKLRAKKA